MRKEILIGIILIFAGSLLLACTPDGGQETATQTMPPPRQSTGDLIAGGHLEEALASGETAAGMEAGKGLPKKWDEQLDGGDDPLKPGCACQHEQDNCGGPIVGRAVDECYPRDGVTLQEKTIPTNCGHYSNKEYNCEKLLGEGARCKLVDLDCCGVATTSGYCYLDITL